MEQKNNRVRLELTDAQKKQVKDATGEDVQVLEFDAKELEQRIAPLVWKQ